MATKGYYGFPQIQALFSVTPGHSLGEESYLSAEMQSVYSTAPADWTTGHSLGEYAVGVFNSPS